MSSRAALILEAFALVGVLLAAWPANRAQAAGLPGEIDAESLGRAGIWGLSRLDLSPGAPLGPGLRVVFGMARFFRGTDLVAGSARLEWVGDRRATALAIGQLRSPVHEETEMALALQVRFSVLRAGIGAGFRNTAFRGYTPRTRLTTRTGLGARLAHWGRVGVVLELDVDRRRPRLVWAADRALSRSLFCTIQQEREPGAASLLRFGLTYRYSALHLMAGYDAPTHSGAAGVALVWPGYRFVFATRTHPELGWSDAWSLVLER